MFPTETAGAIADGVPMARRLTTATRFEIMRWRRQRRLIEADPLALEPRVAPHARQLGLAHVYVADETGETARWLTSALLS